MNETQDTPVFDAGKIKLFHVVVLASSLVLTLAAWQYAVRQVDRQTEHSFYEQRDQTLGLIIDRMNKYEDALWAGVAAVESHGGEMTHPEWEIFAHTLRIEERYPGINGIGVTQYHSAESLTQHINAQRQLRPGYTVFPPHDQQVFMPITFIEPVAENAAAVGLDLAHEENRRTAALASRDTGTAQITGPITLVQDAGQTAGFLFYAPVYRDGPPADPADREARFLGTVYAPFVVHRLMEGLLAKELRQVRFDIKDGDQLIYDEHLTDDPRRDPKPLFSKQVSLDFYGRSWTLDIRTELSFRQNNNFSKPTLILLAGLIVEMLIIALLYQMSQAHSRAVTYADQVTAALHKKTRDLKDTNLELSNTNNQLERFTYVASHDLKTPLRGISGLTEMIEEDLEDYLASPNANPDVPQNLSRIQERVHRMNELTHGIMEYAQVGKTSTTPHAPLKMSELVETLRLDFGLKPHQLILTGDVESVAIDTLQFRRVFENLVGNAVKYHDGAEPLIIEILISDSQDRYRISVKDNGPGIAQEFHQRIFDVFQTLRKADAPESTGIGLSIVKKAVEGHGGQITLTSALGEGATFTFDWPRGLPNDPHTLVAEAV